MAGSPTYPLLPYSQLVFDMLKTTSDVYTTRLTIRIDRREVDMTRLKRAIETAFRNHPAFSMDIDNQGMQYCRHPFDILHGRYHAVDFWEEDDSLYIDIRINRILGDGWSDVLLVSDVARAYDGLSLLRDGYMEYLQRMEEFKRSTRYAANRAWLEAEFASLSCPVHPYTDIPISGCETPLQGTLVEDYDCLRESLNAFADKYLLSYSAFFSLASALAMMAYDECDEVGLTWAYDGRETEENQHIYGSLHRDIPFKICKASKEDMIRATRKQFREGIAHSSYPFTLTKPHTDIWNYALNVLIQPSVEERLKELPFSVEIVEPAEKDHIAYSLLDVEILDGEKLFINYRYSATHYKESSIRRFASLVRKYAEWLLECKN